MPTNKMLLTWKREVKLKWTNWDLGLGICHYPKLTYGDVLLVRGKWNDVYALVVTETNKAQFRAQFVGVIWTNRK
jgi:hypothetical protein